MLTRSIKLFAVLAIRLTELAFLRSVRVTMRAIEKSSRLVSGPPARWEAEGRVDQHPTPARRQYCSIYSSAVFE
jgi:hypothetical protein